MQVSETLQVGFALAATIARDPGAKQAYIGIAREVASAWCGLARDLERLSKAERRERIRQLARAARDRNASAVGGPHALRVQALLGRRSVPRSTELTLPRPGFVPEPSLLARLARIAPRGETITTESPSAFGEP
jgi:hypothetical protein